MTHKTTITDNYILITSDGNIDNYWYYIGESDVVKNTLPQSWFDKLHDKENYKNVIAHLPLNNSPILEGVPLLPLLPSGEDDVEKMAEQHQKGGYDWQNEKRKSFKEGYNKAREKYRFTEEDVKKAIVMATTSKYDHKLEFHSQEEIIQSLSQPKIPIGFKCEMGTKYFEDSRRETHPIIVVNQEGQNVMLGEWIY